MVALNYVYTFIDTHSIKRKYLCPLLKKLGRLWDFTDSKNVAEMIPCDFPGQVRRGHVAPAGFSLGATLRPLCTHRERPEEPQVLLSMRVSKDS